MNGVYHMTKIFKSIVCLKCKGSFPNKKGAFTELKNGQMSVADNIGFEAAEITCLKCGEVHTYQVDKDKLRLQLVAFPMDYKGLTNEVFHPDDTSETIHQKVDLKLLEAVKNGNYHETKDLIGKGASVNTVDNEGKEVLYYAAAAGNLDIVRYLVEQGAKVDMPASNDHIPLDRAAQEGHLDIVKYLANHGSPIHNSVDTISPLGLAAQNGHLDVVKYFVDEKGLEVNCNYVGMGSPLHFAASGGYLEIVRFLVERGADTTLRTELGSWTPVEMAKSILKQIDESTNMEAMNREDATRRIENVIKFLKGETDFEGNEVKDSKIILEDNYREDENKMVQKKWWEFWK